MASKQATIGLGRTLRLLAWLLIVVVALGIYRLAETFFSHLFGVALLFLFASVLALLLTPAVDGMQRFALLRSHRALAAVTLYCLIALGIVGIGYLLGPPLLDQGRHFPELVTRLGDALQRLGLPLDLSALTSRAGSFDLGSTLGLVTGIVGAVINVALVTVISIYLLIEGRAVLATLRNLFPQHTRSFDFVVLATGSTVGAYVRGQLFMSFLIGMYTAITMAALQVHYALLLGVLAFLLEFVPLIGAAIAMVAAVSVAFLQSTTLGIEAGVVGLVGHALEAYVVGPRVAARVTQLHPLVAMASLLIGGEVAGVVGALFAVPTAAVANILLGALYRSRQGDVALSTHRSGKVKVESLPRLGEEIAVVEDEGVVAAPVPRKKVARSAGKRPTTGGRAKG